MTSATLAFGGVMEGDAVGSHAVRASGTEKFLVGKQLTNDVLQEALATLKKELVCTGAVKSEYRHRLVTGFFFKFFVAAADGALGGAGAGEEKKSGSSAVGRAVASAGLKFVRPVSKGKQEYKYSDEHAPVSQPTAKFGMDLQCSGQAECTLPAAVAVARPHFAIAACTADVDDVKPVAGTVYGGWVLSTTAVGKITGIDAAEAEKAPGFIRLITAKVAPACACLALGSQAR